MGRGAHAGGSAITPATAPDPVRGSPVNEGVDGEATPLIRGGTIAADGKQVAAAVAGLAQSTMFSSVVNLANTIVGAGMLGLPRAFAESGYAVGAVLLMASAIGSTIGLHLLAVSQATARIQPSSFYTVANAAMPSLTVLIDIAVYLKCFGVGTSYLIVVGDLMPDAMKDFGVDFPDSTREFWVGQGLPLTAQQFWIFLGFVVVVPLSCLRTLDALKFTSTAALAFVLFIVVFVLLFAIDSPRLDDFDPCPTETNGTGADCRGDSGYLYTSPIRTLKVFSIFIFAFTCQQNVFQVCSEMKDATLSRIDRVIGISIGAAWLVYMAVSVAGFETYGDNVKSDILVNYPLSTVVSIARIAITLLVVFSYPLQSHPARKCLLTLYVGLRHGKRSKEVPTNVEFYAATAFFLAGTFAVAMTVRNLGTILGLVGATGSTAVTYILPGAIYWRLHPWPHTLRNVAAIQFVIGCCITPLALTLILI